MSENHQHKRKNNEGNHNNKQLGGHDESEQHQQKPKDNHKAKRKKLFIYGNYNTYYGYRVDKNTGEDPRLAVFKREWFEGKDVLDIGCNEGLVTVGIAKKFYCRSICGIDIDKGLVEAAHWCLRKMLRSENNSSSSVKRSRDLDSTLINSKKHDLVSNNKENTLGASPLHDLTKTVSFMHGNFLESFDDCSEKYDTILCLSVTKWIHLNWKDDGLIDLFVKVWRLLRPGGIFILEPQPWSSYKKCRISETLRDNYWDLCFRPHHFREILLDKVGFKSTEIISDSLSGAVLGFDRPIEVYFK